MMLFRKLLVAVCATTLCLSPGSVWATTLTDAISAVETGDRQALLAALDDPALVDGLDADERLSVYVGLAGALVKAGAPADAVRAYELALRDQADDSAAAVNVRRAYAAIIVPDRAAEAARQLSLALGALEAAGARPGDVIELAQELSTARMAAGLPEDWRHEGWVDPATGETTRGGKPGPAPKVASKAFDLVEVFYATTRKATGSRVPTAAFGADAGPLTFGRATVSVPRDRRPGELPTPNAWAFEFRPDNAKHFILKRVEVINGRDRFFSTVSGRVAASRKKEVLVFIHGYNTSFQGGVERAAQLAVDLGLDGAPILYSWPSQGSLLGYSADAASADDQVRLAELSQFLADVAARTGATRINVVAHSMGNRYLVRALDRLARQGKKNLFNEVVFAAPDVSVDEFRVAWPRIKTLGRRTTVYASGRDKALQVSEVVNGKPRVGDARHPFTLPGLQTVDTTAASGGMLGHDDFAGTALDDFRAIIWLSLAPDRRCVLSGDGRRLFWRFASGCPASDFRQATMMARVTGSPQAAQKRVEADLKSAKGAESDRLSRVLRLLQKMAAK